MIEAAHVRPSATTRVIVTSSATARIADLDIPGAVVVSMSEVLRRPDSLLISALMLDARIKGISVTIPKGPLTLTQEGRRLIIRDGPDITFRAPGQIAVIKKLIEGYPGGQRYRSTELLKRAGSKVGSLQRLFGTKKWRELSPYLNQVNSRWGFDL